MCLRICSLIVTEWFMKALYNPVSAIAAATAMLLIGSQSASAATACASINPQPTISGVHASCKTNAYNWTFDIMGSYTCPCIGGQPSNPTLTCNGNNADITKINPTSGNWGCEWTATNVKPDTYNQINVSITCKNGAGSAQASTETSTYCNPLTF